MSVQAAIVELLLRLQAERGLSLLFITHNLPLVRSIADDVTVISAGEICERGPVSQVLSAPWPTARGWGPPGTAEASGARRRRGAARWARRRYGRRARPPA